MSLADRIAGCLMGGAIGDAWGSEYEGRPQPIDLEPFDGGPISDDTQLTIATCEAIVAARGVDPAEIADHFLACFQRGGITGIGASTLVAMRSLQAGADWSNSGATGERSAGNGAAMRIAPLAFLLDPDSPDDRRAIRDVCRITHKHDEAYIGALAIVHALRAILKNAWQPEENLPALVAEKLPDSVVRDRLRAIAPLVGQASPEEIGVRFGSSGYVADSVPLAIFAANELAQFEFADILASVIEAGGDTDTNASLTGQVCGAYLGAASLPREMTSLLAEHDELDRLAKQLATLARL